MASNNGFWHNGQFYAWESPRVGDRKAQQQSVINGSKPSTPAPTTPANPTTPTPTTPKPSDPKPSNPPSSGSGGSGGGTTNPTTPAPTNPTTPAPPPGYNPYYPYYPYYPSYPMPSTPAPTNPTTPTNPTVPQQPSPSMDYNGLMQQIMQLQQQILQNSTRDPWAGFFDKLMEWQKQQNNGKNTFDWNSVMFGNAPAAYNYNGFGAGSGMRPFGGF